MKNDKVSVIVPVYKVEKYLNKCVDSIISQTYKNLEIILVDDGSPDNCPRICDEYAQKDDRIKVIHKQNGGLSDARNAGIDVASGEYIAFVDSDDYINKLMIETLYKDMIVNNVDISVVGYKYVAEGEKISSDEEISTSNVRIVDKTFALTCLFGDNQIGNYAWNKLYARELFNDIRYPKGKKMEDLGTTYLLFQKASKISLNDAKLYNYLQRGDSIVHIVDTKLMNDKFELSEKRFWVFENEYAAIKESRRYMLETILYNYPYLLLDNKIKAQNAMKEIKKTDANLWKEMRQKFEN